MMEYVRCDLCGADETTVRYPCTVGENPAQSDWSAYACTNSGYGRHHTIVQCCQCGLVYTNPRLDQHDILDTYQAVEDSLYLEEREGRVLTFEHHLKPLELVAGPPDGRPLLDVGCYTGVFVEIAARHGWDAWGVEPSRWAVRQAQERGLHVVQGTLNTADLPKAHFDVVTTWDVIEHVTDPRGLLQQVHRLLKPGGLVVVHTIDIESLFARLMGSRWPWLMEMHIYYFSRRTLRAMLEKCGFQVLSDRPQGRYLRLGYLTNRVGALMPPVGRSAEWLVTKLGLRGLAVPINLGDLFTAYARKV
ncbi:MAG: class I SAM-dependent methyltransferase [Chloroflexi bacterium]|nr:class I SAM-dependent methyltransferase [Chloroflexota bacterium]